MPLIDLPVDQLYKYEGRNPKPDDFDKFWDSSIAEMNALDPQVELVPRALPSKIADCFDLYFKGSFGARVHAKYLRPKNAVSKHPAVVMFHGYSGWSGDWSDKLSFVSQGFSVFALDVRGQAGESEDVGGITGRTYSGHFIRGIDDADPRKMLFRNVFLDCAQLAGIAISMPEVDPTRVAAYGHSQGGALTLIAAALEPRIARAVTVYPFLCDYLRVYEMDLAVAAYDEIRAYFRSFDPTHTQKDEIFRKLGYIDVQHFAPRIKAKTLMLTGLMDTICPPSTQFAAYNKIKAEKSVVFYPDYGHEDPPGQRDTIFEFFADL